MMKTRDKLLEIMGRYTIDNLVISAGDFRARIEEYLALKDWEMEGYSEEEKDAQREHSIKFSWGHNHDFGTFQLEGVLGDRHIDLIETFVNDFGLPLDLSGKRVLDVGVWCGGTSLLLAGMGARVTGVEEVKKYADCAHYLCKSFGTDSAVFHNSVYDPQYEGTAYDFIIFPGALYHLSDPLVALRILFNALKDGGELYIETKMIPKFDVDCENGYLEFDGGKGNNWFTPDPNALHRMCASVGFKFIDANWDINNENRAFAKYRREEWKPMLRAGLSRRIR